MAHEQQKQFCIEIQKKFPEYFSNVTVLDIGSLDINGSNKHLFSGNIIYIGLDLAEGENVDIAASAHEVIFPNETFDIIISTETLEHDRHWADTLRNAVRMLRPGGMLLTTCATTGRPEHGTRRTTPQDAPLLGAVDVAWSDYYRNITEDDYRSALDIENDFQFSEFSTEHTTHDLYFVGIKSGKFTRRTNRSVDSPTHPFQVALTAIREKHAIVLAEVKQLRADISALVQTNFRIMQEADQGRSSGSTDGEDAIIKQRRIDDLTAQVARTAEELDQVRREAAEVCSQRDAILHSTIWRLTNPLRDSARRMPPSIRLFVRRLLKSLYWVVTPHRMPARIAFLRQRNANSTQGLPSAGIPDTKDKALHYLPDASGFVTRDFDPAFYRFVSGNLDISDELAHDDYLKHGKKTGLFPSILSIPKDCLADISNESENPSPIKASIGIVTYGTSMNQVETILKSAQIAARRCDSLLNLTIRIMDNGSSYDPMIFANEVMYQKSPKNVGFGEAHNRLMQEAFANSDDLYIAANPDGAFHPDCIKNLIALHNQRKGRALIEALQFPQEHPKYYDPVTLYTPWVSGACILIPRAIWQTTGGFDPQIFLYCEDVDLSWMARRAGFETLTCPLALFWHDLTDRVEEEWRTRELLISGRYLAHKWNDFQFREWAENHLVGRGMVLSKNELPPLEDLPIIKDGADIADFSHDFHFSSVRWW